MIFSRAPTFFYRCPGKIAGVRPSRLMLKEHPQGDSDQSQWSLLSVQQPRVQDSPVTLGAVFVNMGPGGLDEVGAPDAQTRNGARQEGDKQVDVLAGEHSNQQTPKRENGKADSRRCNLQP